MSRRRRSSGAVRALWAAAAVLMLVACGVLIWSRTVPAEPAPLPPETGSAQPEPSETPAVPTVRGTVADAAMSMLVVETADGGFYRFDTTDVPVDGGENGLLLGSAVAVTYRGELPAPGTQDAPAGAGVEVLSVTVETDPANPITPPPTADSDPAAELLAGMTVEEKVGQLFIARCPKTGAVDKLTQYHLGGYILFARDFENRTPDQAAQAIESYQAAADIPLLIGVDEEGGTVTRVSRYPAYRDSRFQSPQAVYAAGGLDGVRADTAEKCGLLSSLGINVNFAPVCDVSTDPDDFMYDRAFGRDTRATAEYVETVVDEMGEQGVACVLKHFPGYGNNEDTHTGIAHDDRSWESFVTSDFLPFEAGIGAGAEMVLVSHNMVACMDAGVPASLSPEVHRILREELGFDGVIVTDDLAMEGVRQYAGDEEVAVLAVLAGNDLLCCTDFETQVPAVLAAVEDGTIPESRLDESVLRVLNMKLEMGLL